VSGFPICERMHSENQKEISVIGTTNYRTIFKVDPVTSATVSIQTRRKENLWCKMSDATLPV